MQNMKSIKKHRTQPSLQAQHVSSEMSVQLLLLLFCSISHPRWIVRNENKIKVFFRMWSVCACVRALVKWCKIAIPYARKISYVCLCVNVNTLHATPFLYIIFYYLWFCISFWKCIFAPEAMHKHSTIPCCPALPPSMHTHILSTLPCAHARRREIWMTHYSSCVYFLFPFFCAYTYFHLP